MSLIQTFEPNLAGRDFVVGDLHGCIDHFNRLLDRIEFNPAVDRMFSVGDLIDRGPDSMACLRLLRQPWFHAVLGNHEDMMLEAVSVRFRSGVGQWLANGGEWAVEHYQTGNDEFFELAELVDQLPIAILIQTEDFGLIGVCHAEPPTDWTEECIKREFQKLLWARQKIFEPEGNLPKSNVAFSVHGHTIQPECRHRTDLNAFWIDLGCYRTGKLGALKIG